MSSIKQIIRNRSLSRSSGGAKRIATSAIPKVDDKTLQTWVKSIDSAVKEVLKQSLTSNDLVNIGLVKFDNGKLTSLIPKEEEVNLTVPLAILNLSARGAYGSVTVIWNTPKSSLFGMNIVYRSELNDFGTAVQVGSTAGDVYTDYIGNNHKVYYWVRTVSKYGVEGHLSPSAYAATSIDIDYLLENLNEKIDESLLDQALRGKIEDTADGLANEEQNRISEDLRVGLEITREAKERALAIANESKLLNQKIAEETQNLINQIENQSNTLSQDTINRVLALQEEIQGKINTLNNGITTETKNRIDEDNAIASSLTAYKTSNNSAVSTVLSKAESAITANNALSSRLDALVASLTESDGTTIDANAFNAMRAEVTTLNGTVSTLVEDVTALENSYSSALDLINTHGSAINTLQTKLTEMGNVVTQSANDITILKSDMGTVKNGLLTKAEAEAVENLETRVTQTEDSQSALSRDVTNLSASITAQAVGDAITGTKDAINALKIVGDLSKVSLVDEPTATTGKVIRLGGNNGNDYLPATSNTFIPIRAERLYRIKYRFRRFAGTSKVYIGLICANSDKTKGITRTNKEKDIDLISAEMFAVSGLSPTTMQWVEGEFYFKGRSTSASTGLGTKESPMTYPAKASYMRLCLISGYLTGAGQYDFDYIILEDAEIIALNDAQASALSSTQAQVVEIDGRVKSSADDLISLKGRVNAAEGVISQKADASALNNYFTKVEAGEATAGQLSKFESVLSLGHGFMDIGRNGVIQRIEKGSGSWEILDTKTNSFKCTCTVAGELSFYLSNIFDNASMPVGTHYTLSGYVRASRPLLYDRIFSRVNQTHSGSYIYKQNKDTEWVYFIAQGTTDVTQVNGEFLNLFGAYIPSAVYGDWVEFKNLQAVIGDEDTRKVGYDQSRLLQATRANLENNYLTSVETNNAISSQVTTFGASLALGGANLFTHTRTFNDSAANNTDSTFYPNYAGFGDHFVTGADSMLFGTHVVAQVLGDWRGFYYRADEKTPALWFATEDMVLSFWVSNATNGGVHVYGIASNLGLILTIPAGGSGAWKRIEIKLPKGTQLRNNANNGIVEFMLLAPNTGAFYYGGVMLQVGNKATSWQPSPRDNDIDLSGYATADALETTNTKVENLGNEMITQASKVTSLEATLGASSKFVPAKTHVLDLAALDPNTYYPVIMPITSANTSRMVLRRNLWDFSSTAVPPWSTHGGGFSCMCDWTATGDGWGTIDINRRIHNVATRWTVDLQPPFFNITQMSTVSCEVIFLRGGAKYYLDVTADVGEPSIKTERFERNGQAVQPEAYDASKNVIATLDTKASSSALNTTNAIVTEHENKIKSTADQVTELSASIANAKLSNEPDNEIHNRWLLTVVQPRVGLQGVNGIGIPDYTWLDKGTIVEYRHAWDDATMITSGLEWRTLFYRCIVGCDTARTVSGILEGDDGHAVYVNGKLVFSSIEYANTNISFELPVGISVIDIICSGGNSQNGFRLSPMLYTQVNWMKASKSIQKNTADAFSSLNAKVEEINGVTSAQSNQLTQLKTTVNGYSATIQSHAASIDGMRTQFTLKMDVNGLVSGIGMMNDGVTSDFIVNANTFAIGSPTSNFRPFIATSTETIINGVQAPAGVHINTALIANGTIKNAQIGDLSADKITTGDIHADRMKANIVKAVEGQFDNLGAITAKIGHLRTADTGARLEFKGNLLTFFDSDDTPIIYIGEWDEDPIEIQ